MKKVFIFAVAGLTLAGCATGENGKVSTKADGTRVYGLDDQPQSGAAGTGTLMHGAYDSRQLPAGQFTGQERTQDVIGQRPTLPREADAREMDHSAAPFIGAGTLGQSGIQPGASAVRGPDLVDSAGNPRGSGFDIYRPVDVGSAPTAEKGSGSNVRSNNVTIPNKVDQ
jgi:hypothetical protein